MSDTITRPTNERMRHGGIIPNPEQRGERAKAWSAVTLPHDCLDMDVDAHQAGHRFHVAYITAHGSDTKTQKWEVAIDNPSRDELSASQAASRADLVRWERQLSPALYGVLVHSCGHGAASSRWAADNGEHPSCGPVLLKAACEQLARIS